ncbi:MAG TPA: hypothetical protein VFP68_08990 [Burkholderiaceae bacterium]|nr:hypothetical protein [Burkholderiaceae bacterium]
MRQKFLERTQKDSKTQAEFDSKWADEFAARRAAAEEAQLPEARRDNKEVEKATSTTSSADAGSSRRSASQSGRSKVERAARSGASGGEGLAAKTAASAAGSSSGGGIAAGVKETRGERKKVSFAPMPEDQDVGSAVTTAPGNIDAQVKSVSEPSPSKDERDARLGVPGGEESATASGDAAAPVTIASESGATVLLEERSEGMVVSALRGARGRLGQLSQVPEQVRQEGGLYNYVRRKAGFEQ